MDIDAEKKPIIVKKEAPIPPKAITIVKTPPNKNIPSPEIEKPFIFQPIFQRHGVSAEEFATILDKIDVNNLVSMKKKQKNNKINQTELETVILKQEKEFFERAQACSSTINNSFCVFQQQLNQKLQKEKKLQILKELKADENANSQLFSSYPVFSVDCATASDCNNSDNVGADDDNCGSKMNEVFWNISENTVK